MDNIKSGVISKGLYHVTAFRADGSVKWIEKIPNQVVYDGLNHFLDVVFHGGAQTATWYIGLKEAGSVTTADTLPSHVGWIENTNYTGDRKEFVETAPTGQSINNTANKALFVANSDGNTIAGLFLCSAATGTTGILWSAGDFATPKTLDTDESLQVGYTINAADDGV